MEILDWLSAAVREIWSLGEVRFLVTHVLVNFTVAVAASVHLNALRLHKLPEFLYRKMLPYVAIYAVVRVCGDYANLGWIAPATWVLVEAGLAADLLENLQALGVPLPEALSKAVRKAPQA